VFFRRPAASVRSGFGTMVRGSGLGEEECRGERFSRWEVQLKGCNDLLALTHRRRRRASILNELTYGRAGTDRPYRTVP